MNNKKKILSLVAIALLLSGSIKNLSANENYAGDINHYLSMCSRYSQENKTVCEGFQKYLEDINKKAEEQLKELQNSKNDITTNITKYTMKLNEYNETIDVLRSQLDFYNERINQINLELEDSVAIIESYENGVFEDEANIRRRILKEQALAHTKIFKNLFFRQTSFDELIEQRTKLTQLMEYDLFVLNRINEELGDLKSQQAETLLLLEEVEDSKNEAQDLLMTTNEMSDEVRKILVEYRKQEAEIIANTNTVIKEIDIVKAQLDSVTNSLEYLQLSSGFIRPVQNGYVSAGTWHYPASFGGGAHSGMDYAAPIGTKILAPANGVIVFSSNGCDNNGYLGNRCGSAGISAAGNQTYFLTHVNGKTFGMSFFHMNANTNLPAGTIVRQGDVIGEIGNSGNTTGPHVHIEVAYLGNMSMESYLSSWNGDLTFGSKLGAKAVATSCEKVNYQAPCKFKPELLFEEDKR